MSSSAFSPSFHLQKVETVASTKVTEILFFDQEIDFVPKNAQLLIGVFLDPSGEGHLEELEGVSVQIDANSGMVLDTLCKGRPSGKLDSPLSELTNVRVSIHIERHGSVFLPHLATSQMAKGLDVNQAKSDVSGSSLALPAFHAPSEIQLSAFCGYYSESLHHPVFGKAQMCRWPDDTL